MYALLSKLILTKRIEFEFGNIRVYGMSYGLLPFVSLKQMTQDALEFGKKGINDLYFYGWIFGYKVTRAIMIAHSLKIFEERYKTSMDFASLTGFGDYKTAEFERGKFSHFNIFKNPFALEFFPSKIFVDHYLRGANAGGGTLVHEKLMQCIEFQCTAQNKQLCEHRNLSFEYLSKLDQALVKSQLDYDYLKKRQIGVIEEAGDKINDKEEVIISNLKMK